VRERSIHALPPRLPKRIPRRRLDLDLRALRAQLRRQFLFHHGRRFAGRDTSVGLRDQRFHALVACIRRRRRSALGAGVDGEEQAQEQDDEFHKLTHLN
jgi:hypothetical protein